MTCSICSIKDVKAQNRIEQFLATNQGILGPSDKKLLKEEFPIYAEIIDKLTEAECQMHWNFHQAASFEHSHNDDLEKQSLTKDIAKDEAEVLYELMNKQAATFNLLTNKINAALLESEDLTCSIVNPCIMDFYKDLGGSIRSTVKEIRELNIVVNGSKSGALEGLKALAQALSPTKQEPEEDLSTDKYEY